MSIESRLRWPCRLVHRTQDGPPDEYGNPTLQTSETRERCYYEQSAAGEATVDRDTQGETGFVALRRDVEVDALAAIVIDDYGTFEVDGPPARIMRAGRRRISHIEISVRRTA